MKHKFKIAVFLGILFFALFSACQNDEAHENQLVQTNPTQETIKVSVDELLGLLKDPEIKNSILENKRKTKSNEDDYFTKIHIHEYDTYSLLLETYTEQTPYYKFFIVTVDNSIEKSSGKREMGFYAQYIPEEENYNPARGFDFSKFVGTLNVLDLDHNVVGAGTIAEANGTGIITICNSRMTLTQMTCSHSGEHGVGDTCSPPLINDAHYIQVEVVTDCFERIVFVGGASGGGGGILPGTGVSYTDWFYSILDTEQKKFMDANSGFKDKINTFVSTLGGTEFAKYLINYARTNGSTSLDSFFSGWDSLNGLAKSKFKEYLTKNNNSQVSCEFIIWATVYMKNNPTVTIEQFENWFMGTSEGSDSDFDEDYWNDPNLSFPQQNLPTWQAFATAYPKKNGGNMPSSEVYQLVGGDLYSNHLANPKAYSNACAIRVSRALNYSGVVIPNIPGQTEKGSDNKNYFKTAKNLNAWMKKTFGTPAGENHLTGVQGGKNGENFPSLLSAKKGIYIMTANYPGLFATGHASIIDNTDCLGNCWFNPPGGVYTIDLWELD